MSATDHLYPGRLDGQVDRTPGSLTTARDLLESTNRELWVAVPATDDTVEGLEHRRRLHLALVGRGVHVWMLCDTRLIEDPRAVREMRIRAASGTRIRLYNRVPQLVAIFDRRMALAHGGACLMDPDALSIVPDGAQLRILMDLFSAMWRSSVAAEFASSFRNDHLESDPVLRALRSGLTDEAAARQLCVSVRTYRREVAKIMRRLGARSRFEAGFLAALADQDSR